MKNTTHSITALYSMAFALISLFMPQNILAESNTYRKSMTVLTLDASLHSNSQSILQHYYSKSTPVPIRYENNPLSSSLLTSPFSYEKLIEMNLSLFGVDKEEIAYASAAVGSQYNDGIGMLASGFSSIMAHSTVNHKTLSSKEIPEFYAQGIIKMMQEQKIPQQIMCHLFNKQVGNYFDMERLKERGAYSAQASEILESQLTIRNQHSLNDVGLKLINNCYIAVTFYDQLESQEAWERRTNQSNFSSEYTLCGDATVLLFHLDLNDSILSEFWNSMYATLSDDTETRLRKIDLLYQNEFPITLESAVKVWNTHGTSGADLFEKSIVIAINELEKETEAIGIQSSISNTSFGLLQAKIGSKEGLRHYDRYAYYENYKGSNNQDSLVRKGYCRVRHIDDNAGKLYSETIGSDFTVINGRRPHEGMILREKKDIGLTLQMNYTSGYFKGPEFQASYGKFYRVGVEAALDLSQGPYTYNVDPFYIRLNQRLLRTGIFAQRVFYARNVSLAINAGGGMQFDIQSYDNKDILERSSPIVNSSSVEPLDYTSQTKQIRSYYYKISSEVSYGWYRFQLVGGASFSQTILTDLPKEFEFGESAKMKDHLGLCYYGGIRFNF